MTHIADTCSPPSPELTDPGSALSLQTSSPAGLALKSASCEQQCSRGLCDWRVGLVVPRGASAAWRPCLPPVGCSAHAGAERRDEGALYGRRTWMTLARWGSIEWGHWFQIWCGCGDEIQKQQKTGELTPHKVNRKSSISSGFSPLSFVTLCLLSSLQKRLCCSSYSSLCLATLKDALRSKISCGSTDVA